MTDEAKEGEWRWLNGEIALKNQTAWNEGEPNDSYNKKDCGELLGTSASINDVPCSTFSSGVCEIDEILHSGKNLVKGKFIE